MHQLEVQRFQNRVARIVSGNYDWSIRGIDVKKNKFRKLYV